MPESPLPPPSPLAPPPPTSSWTPTRSEPIRPSGYWYWLVGAIAAVAIVVAVVLLVIGILDVFSTVDDLERVEAGDPSAVELDQGNYTVYLEYPGASDRSFTSIDVEITGPSGPVELDRYGSSFTYDYSGHEGRAAYTFHAETTGSYDVRVSGGPSVEVAIGKGFAGKIVRAIVLSLVVGLGGLAVAVTLFIFLMVKRGSAKRRRYAESLPAFQPPVR